MERVIPGTPSDGDSKQLPDRWRQRADSNRRADSSLFTLRLAYARPLVNSRVTPVACGPSKRDLGSDNPIWRLRFPPLRHLAKLIRQMKERAPFLCQNCAGTRWLQARESLSPKQIPQVWSQRTLNYSVAQFQKNLGCGTLSRLFFVFRFVDMLADEGHHISRLLHSR